MKYPYLCYDLHRIKMKYSFQIITISIISALTIVLCWQIYWLHGLYQNIRRETYATVTSAVEMADFKELYTRTKTMEKKNKERERKHLPRQHKSRSFNYDFELYAQSPLKMMRVVDGGIHNLIDDIEPLNFAVFCRHFKQECKQKGIDVEVYEVNFKKKDKYTSVRYTPPGMKGFDLSTATSLITYHNIDGKYTYEVYTAPLTRVYLQRMSGIILTTLLIILLLAIAFWYLIHTIINQKSIEEMKDDFTNNMTHELKTPIAVTYSAVDTLLNFKQGDDKEKRERYLKICEEQLKRLSGLVERILSMSMERRKTLTMKEEEIELSPMVKHLIEEYKLKSDKETVFDIDILPEEMTIHADPMHISNAISNLIDNAIKYSGEEVHIKIKAFSRDRYDIISVADNGIGITADNQKRIFDKFYRVPHGNIHNVGGYGLGLYYVRQIIDRHEGSITVESELGKGTTFTIKLLAS